MTLKLKNFGVWLVAALFASTLVVGVPVLLVMAGDGWPGPTSIPTWDELTEVFGPGGMTDQRVLAMVVLAGWVTWLHVLYVFLVEFVAAVRGRSARQVRASGLTQRVARMAVSGLFRLGATSTAVFGVVGPTATVGLVAASSAPAGADVVGTMRDFVVTVPKFEAGAETPVGTYLAEPIAASPRDGKTAYEVLEGDHLWSIAETHLGDGFRYREIFDASKGFQQAGSDGRTITDPDMIWPGSILLLPGDARNVPVVNEAKIAAVYGATPGSDATATTPSSADAVAPYSVDDAASSTVDAPSEVGNHSEAARAVGEEPLAPPELLADVVATEPASDASEIDTVPDSAVIEGTVVDGPARLSMKHVGFGATGVVLLVAVVKLLTRARLRRQARLQQGEVPAELTDDQQELDTELRQGGDEEFVSFVGSAWSSLAARPFNKSGVAVPVVASLDGDRLQVQMSRPDESVFDPWELQPVESDEFSVWEVDRSGWQDYGLADYDAAAFPLMVPIGSRSFLNFEATGPVSLLGDSERSAGFVRAVCMERLSELGEGFDLRVTPSVMDNIRMGSRQELSTLVPQVLSWGTATLEYLDSMQAESSFAVRAGQSAEPFAVMVVCSADEFDDMSEIVALCSKRRLALSVVVMGRCDIDFVLDFDALGQVTFGPTRLRDDESAYVQIDLGVMIEDLVEAHAEVEMLPPDQVGVPQVFAAAPVPVVEPSVEQEAIELVADEDAPVHEFVAQEPGALDPSGPEPLPDEAPAEEVLDLTVFDEPSVVEPESVDASEKAIRLRVLGPVTLEGLASDLTSPELSMFTYLGLEGEQTATTLRDALWGYENVTDEAWWQMCRRLRKKLGADVFPKSDSGRYSIRGVITDFYEFQEHTKRARNSVDPNDRVDIYLDALQLVIGEPLGVPGKEQYWSWVHSTEQGMLNHIEIQISDAVRECIEAAAQVDRLTDAALACTQGLKASPLNEPVIEMFVEVLMAQGKQSAAQRVVEDYERRAFDLFDGEPSPGPRSVLTSRVA